MIIQPNQSQQKAARELSNFRGKSPDGFDGNMEQRYFGMLAQVIICDKLGLPRPEKRDSSDGGTDFTISGITIDVKAMRRITPRNFETDACAIKRTQVEGLKCDAYILADYKPSGEMDIWGYLLKAELLASGIPKAKGEKMIRSWGRDNVYPCDCYAFMSDLPIRINSIGDLQKILGVD